MLSTTYDAEKKEWSGCELPPLYNSKISLAQVIFNTFASHKTKIAQISDNNGIKMSFDEIRIKTIRAAQNLQNLGYKPKQVFGLMAKNSHHVAPIVFASISIGCPVNTLDPSFGKIELNHMLKTTKPALMFCDIEAYDLVKECLRDLKNDARIFTFGGIKDGVEPVETLFSDTQDEDEFVPITVDGENDIAMIICSSGTTGLSKGVCLSHAAILYPIIQHNSTFNSSDVILCFSSLYWFSGISILFRGTIIGATRIITTEAYSPELQLRLIEQYKVTIALNPPHHIILMIKSDQFKKTDLSSMKMQLTGGSKVPLHVQMEMNSYLPNGQVYIGYGMSEIAGNITLDSFASSGKDSVGRLVNGYRVKIIDDEGNRVGINIDGEICIKSIFKFIGYYGNQKATNELFDNEGFIMTGDIGHFDEDGYLFIVDRKKDLLKYRNMQISPSEIDSFLIESPDINSACIVGIPDEVNGDLPAAVIIRAELSNITEDEVYNLVAAHFSDHYKLRGGVYFVDSLPTTPSGKLLRRKAKEMAIEFYNSRKK